MTITINGKRTELEQETTVQKLLDAGYVEMQEYVTVQLNGEIIPKEEYAAAAVTDGAVLEFLYYMGGGSVQEKC